MFIVRSFSVTSDCGLSYTMKQVSHVCFSSGSKWMRARSLHYAYKLGMQLDLHFFQLFFTFYRHFTNVDLNKLINQIREHVDYIFMFDWYPINNPRLVNELMITFKCLWRNVLLIFPNADSLNILQLWLYSYHSFFVLKNSNAICSCEWFYIIFPEAFSLISI